MRTLFEYHTMIEGVSCNYLGFFGTIWLSICNFLMKLIIMSAPFL